MKAFALTILLVGSGMIAVFAGCKAGNSAHQMVLKTSSGSTVLNYCCKPVGDGSVLSCTNGHAWWNEPN